MPFELSWPAPHTAFRRFAGHVTDAEFTRSFKAVMADPRFDDLRFNVVDLTPVESFSVSDDSLEMLATMAYGASKSNARVEVTIVAPTSTGQQLVRRFMDFGLAPYPVHVFASYGAANSSLAARQTGVRFQEDGGLTIRTSRDGSS